MIKIIVVILVLTCATAYAEEIDFEKLLSMKSEQTTSIDKKKALLELFTENERLELLAIDEHISRSAPLAKSIGFLGSNSSIEFIDLAIHYEFFRSNFKNGVFKCMVPARDSYGKIEEEITIKEKTLRGVVMYLKARISTKYVGWPKDEMDDMVFKIEATYEFYKEIWLKEKERLTREQEFKSLKLKYDYDREQEDITPVDVFLK